METLATPTTARARGTGFRRWMAPGVLPLLLSATGFGLMAIFAKMAYAAGVNLPTLLTGRFTLAAVILWGLVLAGRSLPRLPVRRLAGLALMGGVGYVGQSFAFFTAVQTIPAAMNGLLLY